MTSTPLDSCAGAGSLILSFNEVKNTPHPDFIAMENTISMTLIVSFDKKVT